jgi:hypothetical protein
VRRIALTVVVAALAIVPAALGSSSLNGTYKTTIRGSKFGAAINGRWKLKVSPGQYKAWHNGQLVVKGTDTVTGHKITLTDTGGPGKCTGTGKYKYQLTEDKLSFTKISDANACVGRETVLKHTFTRVS